LLVGPVFTREVVTVPRRPRLYVARTAYVAALLVLMATAWLILAGTQVVRNVGDLARFGAILFQILAPLQLALAILFSALLSASAVSQEKDRKTLILLLLTNLSNSELVLGKLLASLLNVLAMLAAALPLFMLSALLGGVSFDQIGRAFAVTLASALVAGSLGSTLALWREKTFQTLALTALLLVFWLAFWEIVAAGAFGPGWLGVSSATWAACFSPWEAILAATQPTMQAEPALGWLRSPVYAYLLVAAAGATLLNAVAVALVRVWNPSRELQPRSREANERESIWNAEGDLSAAASQGAAPTRSVHDAPGKTRTVWDNPILWRELRTWAYGRKVLVIRAAYLLLFAAAAVVLHNIVSAEAVEARTIIPLAARPLIPLFVLSWVLVNALAVTSITTERDGRALDLLLVTDLSPQEIIFGKLGGVFYNTKEMILLPMLLCVYLWYAGGLSGENLFYVLGGLLVMDGFAAMLGVHAGMIHANSRSAIGVSVGTLLFLFIGIATCMRLMIAFSGSFQGQLQPFLAFMLGGGVGLYVALGTRNPSPAIGLASFGAPIATFYIITSFILGHPLAVFFVTVATYGFATAAMLVPALYEFDVATGRAGGED
jgi:ABC-type transport system involved in multi-copper enzyme maturation permease subunit